MITGRLWSPMAGRMGQVMSGRHRPPWAFVPPAGSGWAAQGRPDRLPATYRRTPGFACFPGCYPSR
nr:hypothetical protein [Acrocarpospora phusangensis]